MTRLMLLLTVCAGILGDPEPRILTLNVGGVSFTTTPSTLTRFPDSLLALNYRPERTSYFYDRDGDIFRHLLNYVRSGRLLLPKNFDQLDLLQEEAKFFNLYMLHDEILELQEKKKREEEKVVSISPTGRLPEEHSRPKAEAGNEEPEEATSIDDSYECVIVCADEDGKVERWFSAPVDLRFENNGCLLGDCEMITGYSHILDYRDYTARPGNTVPDHFNIAAIVARMLKAGFQLTSSSSGIDEWHREFYFVFVRRIKKTHH